MLQIELLVIVSLELSFIFHLLSSRIIIKAIGVFTHVLLW